MEKLRISKDDLKNVVEPLARAKNWKRQDKTWAMAATVSIANLKRFWSSTPIGEDHVERICLAVGLDDYRAIAIVGEADSVSSSAKLSEPKTNWFAFDEGCVGRDRLVADLRDRLKTVRILGLVGLTGIGKTALAERLAQDTQEQWGKILRVNFDDVEKCKDFYTVAIALLEGLGAVVSPEDRKDPEQLRNWLIGSLALNRHLVLFDSMENILQGNIEEGWSGFTDGEWQRFFDRILTIENFASCILLTSQDLPVQIEQTGARYPRFWYRRGLRGLDEAECLQLFRQAGFEIEPESPALQYVQRIGKVYEGHPLALRAIAGEMGDHPFYGDILGYWEQYGQEIEAVERILEEAKTTAASRDDQVPLAYMTKALYHRVRSRLEKTFERLKIEVPFAYLLLCEGSMYRCAVPMGWWLMHFDTWDDLPPGWTKDNSRRTLDVLRDRYLVEDEAGGKLRLHSLIRSIALERFKNEFDDGGDVLPFSAA